MARNKSDGSVIIDSRMDTSGISKGMRTVKGQIGGLTGALGKLGVAIGLAFSVKEIIRFGKEAINLGSDLEEVQNVVDVTFSTMSEKVDAFAKNAAKSAGLSETMAKKYVGTFGAMSKAFGFAESESLGMATALTQLSGDVASFYNLTQDEAYTKLKSVFTGETESLKDLGVVMTQSALDSFAMANGFGKTTKAMSEQEKVALRYRFVMDQLSGASGDFERTSGGWANQVRVLKLQMESFMATIGTGLINLLTPAIQNLNVFMEKLILAAKYFKAFTELIVGKKEGDTSNTDRITSGLNDLEDGYNGVTESVNNAKKANDEYLSSIDEINKIGAMDNQSVGSISGGIGDVDFGGDIDFGTSNAVQEFQETLIKNGEKVKKIFEETMDVVKAIGAGILAWKLASAFTKDLKKLAGVASIATGITLLFENIDAIATGRYNNVSLESAIKTVISGSLVGAGMVMMGAGIWALPLSVVLSFAVTNIIVNKEQIKKHLSSMIDTIMYIFDENWGAALDSTQQAILESLTMDSWFLEINKVIADGIFGKGTWDKAIEVLSTNKHVIRNLGTLAVAYVADGVYESINTVIRNVRSSVLKGITDLGVSVLALMNQVYSSAINNPINLIISGFNLLLMGLTTALNNVIRSLNKFKVTIPSWMKYIPGAKDFAGKSFGFNIPTMPTPKIPYLATGAVIPPKAPFMAVLGDQKQGTNIETPEKLLRQIIRDELGNKSGGNYHFVGQINRRVLFEEVINEARLRQEQNGMNPFELA